MVLRKLVELHSLVRDNYKKNKRFYETLESPVFSRVLFMSENSNVNKI